MTLIEVVAGLALMASLVTSLLWAKSQAARRYAAADARVRAVGVADALLTAWYRSPKTFPRSAEGAAPAGADHGQRPPYRWRTRPVPAAALDRFGGQVVRVEIFDAGPSAGARPAGPASDADAPIVTVDVVVPAEGIDRDR